MGWVKGRYYQRSVRRNGRVTTEYHGSGALGQAWAVLEERASAEARERRRLADESRRAAEAERERGRTVRTMLEIGLEACGFRRYQRNAWKRRRPLTLALTQGPAARDEVRELIHAVKDRVPGALAELRELARAHPAEVVRQTFADLAKLAHGGLVGRIAGDNEAFNEGLRARLRLLIAELADAAPVSPARRLCIEAISYSWLEFWSLTLTCPDDQARLNGAHRRLLLSLKTLTQITAAERPRPRHVQHATQVNVNLG